MSVDISNEAESANDMYGGFKLKKPFSLYGLYKHILALCSHYSIHWKSLFYIDAEKAKYLC